MMRIVDVVYATRKHRPQSRHVIALLAAAAVHAAVVAYAASAEPGLGPWSSALALMVHDELARENVVMLEEPPQPAKALEQPRVAPPSRAPSPVARRASEPAQKPSAAAAAEAAPVMNSEVPVEFPELVTGRASSYAGGRTRATGTDTRSVDAPTAPTAEAPADQALPVRLAADEWSCPWPDRAHSEHIDEQSVVIKVLVREDGSVVEAKIVRDAPGGFGQAALLCAKRTLFLPARDASGAVVRRWSPAIEVRFWR